MQKNATACISACINFDINGFPKCGKRSTGLEERSSFNLQKACSQVSFHSKTTVSLVNQFKGREISAHFWTTDLQKPGVESFSVAFLGWDA